MDLRLLIAFIGAGIAVVSIRALTTTTSAAGTIRRDIVLGLTLAFGIMTTVTAPLLSGLIRYTTGGPFDIRWWW